MTDPIVRFALDAMEFDGRLYDAGNAVTFINDRPATGSRNSARRRLVRGVQHALRQMGIGVADSGLIDRPTATALSNLLGANWPYWTWRQIYAELKRQARR